MTDLRKAVEELVPILDRWKMTYPPCTGADWDKVEALRQALANEFNPDWDQVEALQESLREHMGEIQRLRQALAQPEQEPVAWMFKHKDTGNITFFDNKATAYWFGKDNDRWEEIPLYSFAEAKIKEKNT